MSLAPAAPGALGEAIQPTLLLRYLQELDAWLVERRQELDSLDEAIRALPPRTPERPGPDPRALTNDIMLSLSLWQAVKQRLELLTATWDSGRVGEAERKKMSVLIWGRLDTTVGRGNQALAGMNLSLPEACRLSDALAGQLSTRLGLTPSADALAARLRGLKMSMERLRDQVRLESPETFEQSRRQLEGLAGRLSDLEARLGRGGDIGGMIGPLEIDAARFERDLIVGGAQRRENAARAKAVTAQLESLQAQESALNKLVERTVRTVSPAPKYAVPDVDALGPVPSDAGALDAYAARLAQVAKAFQVVQQAYGKALADHQGLVDRLAEARRLGAARGDTDPAMAEVAATAERLLATSPTPITVARSLVEAYANHVNLVRQEDR